MKIILFLSLILTFNIQAKEIRGHFITKDYDSGIKNSNKISFEGESTKMGLITTKWDGIVKDYTIVLEEENNMVKAINLSFPISSMDTDGNSRNEKMQNICLDANQYKDIRVTIPGPINLDGKENKYQGTILVRGKVKPLEIKMSAHKVNQKILATGSAKLSFKQLEIPDPSIMVAKVDDSITIIFVIEIE